MTFHYLTEISGVRVLLGLIMLLVAFHLAWSIQQDKGVRQVPDISKLKMIFLVLITDFSVCIDSVMIASGISFNPIYVAAGIFLSITTVILIFESFSGILIDTSFAQIIACGLIGHIALLNIIKDPISKIHIIYRECTGREHQWIDVLAVLDIAIIIIIVGVLRRLHNRNEFR